MLLVEVTENSMSVSNCDAIKLCGVRILLYEYVWSETVLYQKKLTELCNVAIMLVLFIIIAIIMIRI